MEFEGELVFTTPDEQRLLACNIPETMDGINDCLMAAYSRNSAKHVELLERKSADDDDLTHVERASIHFDERAVRDERKRLDAVFTVLFEQEVELYSPELN